MVFKLLEKGLAGYVIIKMNDGIHAHKNNNKMVSYCFAVYISVFFNTIHQSVDKMQLKIILD